MPSRLWLFPGLALIVSALATGCNNASYQRAADKEVYGIVGERQRELLGTTNSFTINTRYSSRKPNEIHSPEIIHERMLSSKQPMTLADALKTAMANSRDYQYHKETVYLTVLALTTERYNFRPKWAATSKVTFKRDSAGNVSRDINSDVSATELLKSGGTLSLSLLNDMLSYYTSGQTASRTTTFLAEFSQPLLRGAGRAIVTENLTQAERNAIYDIRSFAHYERTFAVDIVTSYFKLLLQKDAVRNGYNNYRNLVEARERAEALSVDRLPAFQVDQARQDELTAKSGYILAVQNYQNSLDDFKVKLGLSLGTEIVMEDSPLEDLRKLGLSTLALTDEQGCTLAIRHRLDLLNEIDKFEDTKRKIEVAANRFLPDLNLFANVSVPSKGPTDYTKFDVSHYQVNGGAQLNLPLDRFNERNQYRTTLINFERQLRSLALSLDTIRETIRQGLRTLEQLRKEYEIQEVAVKLAQSRVESAALLLQAGRAQMRDLLDAQAAQLTSRNALTAALVNYHAARWTLLTNLGVIRTDIDRFWVAEQKIPQPGVALPPAVSAPAKPATPELISPEELFR